MVAASTRESLRDRRALLIGDLVVIVGVLSVGIVRHRGPGGLRDVVGVLDTVVPFVIGWLLLAPLLGAYGDGVAERRWHSMRLGAGAWTGAAIGGAAIRATPAFGGGATPVFVAVVAATGGLAIGLWRLTVATITSRDRESPG